MRGLSVIRRGGGGQKREGEEMGRGEEEMLHGQCCCLYRS